MAPLSDSTFYVLLVLGEGPAHGYAISKAVEAQSGGRLAPTTGALYQLLQRLVAAGLIAPADAPAGTDPRRKYFALTALGRKAAAAEAQRLEGLVRTARKRKLYPQGA